MTEYCRRKRCAWEKKKRETLKLKKEEYFEFTSGE